MEISGASISALFTSWNVKFQQAFAAAPSYFEQIATVIPSSTKVQGYPWSKRTLTMREWIGPRVLQSLETNLLMVPNRKFEATMEVDKTDLEDDQYGLYAMQVPELARLAKVHPDVLIFGALKAAVANIDAPTAAPIDVMGVSIPVPVCWDDMTLLSATGHAVGPAGDTAAVANVNTSGSGPYWFLIDSSRAITPLFYQKRKEYAMVHMNAVTDEWVFMNDMYRYGVDGRDAVATGLWQMIYASNQTLNLANYVAARTAMRSVKNDNGYPFGAWAVRAGRKLVVPVGLEDAAKTTLKQEWGPGEGSYASTPQQNVWMNDADIVVSEYLD